MSNLWGREPALLVAALGALIALGVSFGLDLSSGQVGAIMTAVSAVLGVVTRSRVSPV